MQKWKIKFKVLKAIVTIIVDKNIDIGNARAICYIDGDTPSPLKIKIESKSAAPCIIAHEAVHASAFICEERGISTQHDQLELVAFMVQYIMDNVCKP